MLNAAGFSEPHLRRAIVLGWLIAAGAVGASPSAGGRKSLPASPAPAAEPQRARDSYGDELPAGAVMRLGSTRLRHETPVRGVTVAPSGAVAASLGDDEVRMWAIPSGKFFFAVPFGRSPVTAIKFSPAGRTMAMGHADGQVNLWDSVERVDGPILVGPAAAVRAVAFSPEGTRLATALADGQVVIWDLETRKEVAHVAAHAGGAHAVAWTHGGLLASCGEDGAVKIWDGKTAALVRACDAGHGQPARAVAFSPDGRTLASGGDDTVIKLWDVAQGKESGRMLWVLNPISQLAWMADGKRVVAGSAARYLGVFDVATAKRVQRLAGHWRGVTGLELTKGDAQTVVSGSLDGTVRYWDPDRGEELPLVNRHGGAIRGVAYSADGAKLALGSEDAGITLWRAADGEFMRRQALPPLPAHAVTRMIHSKNSAQLVTGHDSDLVFIWSTGSNEEMMMTPPSRIKTFGDRNAGLALSADGRLLAACSAYKRIRVFDLEKPGRYTGRGPEVWMGQERFAVFAHEGGVPAAAFSPDGAWLATGGDDGKIKLWGTANGAAGAVVDGHPGGVTALAYGPGNTLWSAGVDGRVKVWDTASWKVVRELAAHQGAVRALVWAPDGTVVASAGDDRVIRLWKPDGSKLRELAGHLGPVTAVSFSPDGARLLSGSTDSTGLVWSLGGSR